MVQKQAQPTKASSNHTRVNSTPLGIMEKKLLIWMAARLPAWVNPDHLTLLGLFASALTLVAYALTIYNKNYLWLASLGFVINWFGDSMDGTLARYRKIERPRYGFFVDHIIDSVSVVMVLFGLGLSPYLRFDLALILLVAYLLASIYVYLSTYVNGVFRISYGGLGPTEMRLIAIGANTIVFFVGNPLINLQFSMLSLYDLIVFVLTLIIFGLFLYNGIVTASHLSTEDRLARKLKARQQRAARAARRQALRDEKVARKQLAKSLRHSRLRTQND